MGNTLDVSGTSSPTVSEDLKPQEQLPEAPVVATESATLPKGSQTPSENLYAALAEERRLRKEAEEKLKIFNTTTPTEEVYSDEGRLLNQRIEEQGKVIVQLQEERELERLFNKFPLLGEKADEFKAYRETEHPRAKLESVAKLFLSDNGLLEPTRRGLESPTGGPRTPMTSEMTKEDVEDLRKNNYKKYKDMLIKGLIKV